MVEEIDIGFPWEGSKDEPQQPKDKRYFWATCTALVMMILYYLWKISS